MTDVLPDFLLPGTEKYLNNISPQKLVLSDKGKYAASPIKNDEHFDLIVEAAFMVWLTQSRIPMPDELKVTGLRIDVIKKIMANEEYKKALLARGVPMDAMHDLTAEQLLTVQVVTNVTDKRDLKTKLKSVGVTFPQYRAWLKQPRFAGYMNSITEGLLTDHTGDLHTVLMERALRGDLNAIKYAHELSGRHDPNRQKVLDLERIVGSLLDSILRHVTDPDKLRAIEADFRVILAGVTAPAQIEGQIDGHNG